MRKFWYHCPPNLLLQLPYCMHLNIINALQEPLELCVFSCVAFPAGMRVVLEKASYARVGSTCSSNIRAI